MSSAANATAYIAKIPPLFIYWWFIETPATLFKILKFIFESFLHLLSYKSLFLTFFRPWKNEYREGLVRFARFMGMAIKGTLIVFDTFLIFFLAILLAFFFVLWIFAPFLIIWGFYEGIFT